MKHFSPPAVTLHQACGVALMAYALRHGTDDSDKKTKLTTLYETGAIDGATLQWALAHYELREA